MFNVILAVTVVLTATAVFYLARRVAALPDEARVTALIEERSTRPPENTSRAALPDAATTPAATKPGGLTERQVLRLIDRRLADRRSGAPSDAELDARVEKGIVAFVEKQRRAGQERSGELAGKVWPVDKNDHVRGNPEAAVTLIEYSDFECPFCKRFHATLNKAVAESNGRLKWVYRYFPLEQLHPGKARKEAEAAECAAELGGNAAFWKFADRFYELMPSNNRTDVDTVLPQIAREIGLDEARFAACVASGRHDRRVEEDYRNAVATGGNGTPWSIIVSKNGKAYPLSGAQPEAVVKQLVDLALREK